MSESLKDQLRSLGLAKEPQKKHKKQRPRKPKGAQQGQKPKGGGISLEAAYRLRDKEGKDAAALAKAEKRAQDLKRQQVNKQVSSLVEGQSLNDPSAELKRNFLYKGRIRTVLVTPAQLEAINSGLLGVVFLRGHYLLVQPVLMEEVRALSPGHVPDLSGGTEDEGEHPVPDDLVW